MTYMVAKSTTTWFYDDDAWTWVGNASSNPGPTADVIANSASGNQDLLRSDGHPYHKLGKGTGDIGGPFSCVRREYEELAPYFHNRTTVGGTNSSAENYRGKYYAHTNHADSGDYPSPVHPSDNEMDVLGTQAINIAMPTKPLTGALVLLGELRSEGIPKVLGAQTWQARTFRARQAGGEYLNAEFGWLPLVSELLSMADTVKRSDEIVSKYEAESGKLLHRTVTFPSTTDTSMSTLGLTRPAPTIKTGYWSGTAQKTLHTSVRTDTWFSGAFTYHLPPEGTMARSAAIANKLYGIRLTPEVVWNLTPWSWAADWFGNIGTVMSNISAFNNDGLVMPYAYLMRRRTVKHVYQLESTTMKYLSRQTGTMRQSFTTTVKSRRKASPYGFGLTFDGFSNRQLATLAALGLSRGSSGMKYQ